MLVAAAATAFFSCQKQEVIAPETEQEVMLTFASEKPAFDDETKTEWTGETIQWSAGDKISIAYTVEGDWMGFEKTEEDQTVVRSNPKLYKSDPLTEATEVAKFNVSSSFNIADEGAHVFYGVYPAPSGTSFDDAPVASLSVPSIQTPNASSFDGAADLMTGVSVDAFNSIAEAKAENISMKWTRLVAHANITLKALKDVTAGETVSSIKLTAQEGANLVGSQKVNLLTNEVECNNNESNVIALMGGNLSVSAGGDIEFWACFLPTTLTSLKVEVETNKASYTREITGIEKTFKQNARNTLSIKMNEATRVAKEEESWVLVRPADGLTEGTYVLVASTKAKTGALVSTNGSSSAPTFNTSVSVSDNTLNGVTEAMQFDLSGTAGNYKLAVTGQTTNYLYTTATNNGVRVGTNQNNVWTITQHESNADAFVFKCNATSRFLGVYNEADWRCYDKYDATNFTSDKGSSQIYLYKKQSGPVVPDTTPSITVEETLELTSAESEGIISVTYKNLEALEAAAYSDEACTTECDWLIALWENDAVSYFAEANEGDERTAYIQIYALDADENEFTKVITVTQEAYVDPSVVNKVTVAEFNALTGSETATYELTGVVAEIYQVYNPSFDNISFYIEDETGKVLIFRMACAGDASLASLKVGDKVTVQGKPTLYNEVIQMAADGVCINHIAACDAPVISCVDNIVTITAETGATIYYTTDGSDPTESSEVYSTTIEVTETNSPMTVKAIAVADGKVASSVASKSCTYVDPNASETIIEESVTFSESGYTNGEAIETVTLGDVTITFAKGSNSNSPKYYNTGQAIRTYGGNTFTFSGANIKEISFTFATGEGTNAITADSGTYANNTWTGDATSVKFTVGGSSGHRRIASVTVKYTN